MRVRGLTPSLPGTYGSPVRLPVTMQNPPSPTRPMSQNPPSPTRPMTMSQGIVSPTRHMHSAQQGQGQSPVKPSLKAAMPDFLEEGDKIEKWLSADAQRARRVRLGMHEGPVAAFADAREFVSLGCFCGVARALQALGVKRLSYPFDWVRAPADGVIHCLDKRFEDFLTFTNVTRPASVKQPVYASTRWGGSFWHHDPSVANTAGDFTRRAERFLGLGEIPAEKPRIFVRSVNNTVEVASSLRMLAALRRALPKCEVRLLVLVDLQTSQGPRCVKGCSSDELLFYFLHEDLFAGTPTQPGSSWTMERHADAYAEALAFACSFWAGQENEDSVPPLDDFDALEASIEQWDGGSATGELFFPRKFQGPRLTIGPSSCDQPRIVKQDTLIAALPHGGSSLADGDQAQRPLTPRRFPSNNGAEAVVQKVEAGVPCKGVSLPRAAGLAFSSPDSSPARRGQQMTFVAPDEDAVRETSSPKAHALAPLAAPDGQTAEFVVPGLVPPGGAIEANLFGAPVRIVLPEGAQPGQWLRLHLSNGVVSCERLAAVASAG